MQTGATITFHDLVYLMIAISDNLATDVLLTKVGIANVKSLTGAPITPATPDDYVTAITARPLTAWPN